MTFTKRQIVRITAFATALLLAMTGGVISEQVVAGRYKRQLELSCLRALQELSSQLNSITVDLEKSSYAGTTAQISSLSAKILKSSGTAKAAFSTLPLDQLQMDNTYRFLSQVGDYAMYLAKKSGENQAITLEERENYAALLDYARQLNKQVSSMEALLRSGEISVDDLLRGHVLEQALESGAGVLFAGTPIGFKEMEDGMSNYPILIYDGPFSDNLMEHEPYMTRGMPEVTRDEARDKAAVYAGIPSYLFTAAGEESSNMPSYTFQGEEVFAAVTKAGGFVTYVVSSRPVWGGKLTAEDARQKSLEFLRGNNLANLEETYYQESGGICTFNYAYRDGDVLCYTDLVKVGVAMDNGQVVFYDARTFINNHRERELPEPTLTAGQAQSSVNPLLEAESRGLVLIPSSGREEVLAYEFKGRNASGNNLLVYVNAETGAEEQILVLLETDSGVTTI